jgi:hypothetical protein
MEDLYVTKPSFRQAVHAVCENLECRQLLSTALPIGTGLTGEYFIGNNFQTPELVRNDATINLNLPKKTPDPSIPKGDYSVRWTGQILPRFTQTYTLTAKTNDEVNVWINGQLVVGSGLPTLSGTIALQAGQKYNIEIEFAHTGTGGSALQLYWASKSQPKQIIPARALFPDPTTTLPIGSGLTGTYYSSANFKRLLMTRVDPNIDFNFGAGTPGPAVPGRAFAVQWVGNITPSYSETYTFYTLSDDGARVWVNNQLIISNWTDHTATLNKGTITLAANTAYDFKVQYFENGVPPGSIQVSWSSASQAKEIVPASALGGGAAATASNVTTTSPAPGDITLNWTGAPAATSYIIERSTSPDSGFTQVGTATPPATTFADAGLNPDTTYYYRITTLSAAGASAPTSAVAGDASGSAVPAAPGNVIASETSSTTATVSWADVADETGFVVLASSDGGAHYSQVGTTQQGVTTLNVTGLTPFTSYLFEVQATNNAGSSPASSPGAATTPGDPTASSAFFAVTNAGAIYLVNTASGAAMSVGTITGMTSAVAREPSSGKLFYFSQDSSAQTMGIWNPANNTNTTIATSGIAGVIYRAAFNPAGTLYITSNNGDLYTVNTTTGAATLLGTILVNSNPLPDIGGDIAFSSNGTLYLSTDGVLFSVDLTTLAATEIGDSNLGSMQIAFGANGALYGTNTANGFYSISLSDGSATLIGSTGISGSLGDLASEPF